MFRKYRTPSQIDPSKCTREDQVYVYKIRNTDRISARIASETQSMSVISMLAL